MEIKSTDIVLMSPENLIPYHENMNKHTDEQIDQLIELIKYQGFRVPIVAQKGTNIIASGHGRWMAASKMGLEKIPVILEEFENESQFYAFVVSDNAINAKDWGGGLDLSKINAKMVEFGPEFDIAMFAIKEFTIEPLEKTKEEKPVEIKFEYKIEVDCGNEEQQNYLTGELNDRGFKVRVLI